MNHPFLKNKGIIFYTAAWLFFAILYGLGLHYFYDYTTKEAFIDSLIFNGIFYALGLAFWFVVRYNSFDSSQVLNLVVSYLAAAALSVTAGVFLAVTILKNVLPGARQRTDGFEQLGGLAFGFRACFTMPCLFWCIILLNTTMICARRDNSKHN